MNPIQRKFNQIRSTFRAKPVTGRDIQVLDDRVNPQTNTPLVPTLPLEVKRKPSARGTPLPSARSRRSNSPSRA